MRLRPAGRLRRAALCVALLAGLSGAAVRAADISAQVRVRPAQPRTRFDRTTGRLVSRVTTLAGNESGTSFLPPLHLVVGVVSGTPTRIDMLDALGGPGDPAYGTFYYDLARRCPGGRLASGAYAAQDLVFGRDRFERFRYDTAPRGDPQLEHPPLLSLDPLAYTVDAGETLAFDMTALDPDGQTVVLTADPALPHAALAATNGVQAAGRFTFLPDETQNGRFLVSFTARDETGLTDRKTVQITVTGAGNRAPTVSAPAAVEVAEGAQITVPVTAADPDGDPVTVDAGPLPDNAVFIQAAGGITFAPDYDQAGVYEVVCRADDGALQSDPATIEITVTEVSGGGGTNALVMTVDEVESPTLLGMQRITGTVNADAGLPPPRRITSALITGLDPAVAAQGTTNLEVHLTGAAGGVFASHFDAASSRVDFGPGVVVQAFEVTSPSQAVARISVAADAAPGPRGVRVVTGAETALAVSAFNVTEGRASIRGRIVDPANGLGVANAVVSVEGTVFTTVSASDGSFVLNDLPEGAAVLLVNPPDHAVLRIRIEAAASVNVDLGELAAAATVYDPTSATGVSIHSLLQRGLGDLAGRLGIDEAREVIRDTMVLVGGDEAGVLDAYGRQLNPEVAGAGLVSLRDSGVDLYAERISRAETVRLLDVFYDLSFALQWSGAEPPSFLEWLAAAQAVANDAWADPGDPYNRVVIAVFCAERQMPPDPPVLSGAMRMNRFQAFLLVSGCMASAYNHQGDWFNFAQMEDPPFLESLGEALAEALTGFFTGPEAYAQAPARPDGIYTFSWNKLLELTGQTPVEPDFASGSTTDEHVPAFEDILRQYYIDGSTGALDRAATLLLDTFPDVALVEEIFDRDPFGVSEAVSNLVGLSAQDQAVRTKLQGICNASGALNLWNVMGVAEGIAAAPFTLQFLTGDVTAKALLKAQVPSPPFFYTAREATMIVQGASTSIRVPALQLEFRASGSDPDPLRTGVDPRFAYRLWRLEADDDAAAGAAAGRWTQVAGGAATTNATDFLRPRADAAHPRILTFHVPFPPAGMNQYRIDCVRSSGAIVDTLTSSNDWAKLTPWLAGYVDDPVALPPEWFDGVGRRRFHPGQTWLRGVEVDYSAMSNPKEIYVGGGGGMGLAAFGRVDLAADYTSSQRLYVSIPGFKEDANNRGSGLILRYDPATGGIEEAVPRSALFMEPGQVGASLDDKGRLYTVNGASMSAYGGKIFRYAFGSSGAYSERDWIGSVYYYSTLLNRSRPTSIQQLVVGPLNASGDAPLLYLADALDQTIKTFDTGQLDDLPASNAWNAVYHLVSRGNYVENDSGAAPYDQLAIGSRTDLAFTRDHSRLFISQGGRVLQFDGTELRSITGAETIFTAVAGLSVCSSREGDFLFVADSGAGRILRIPLDDIPTTVSSDPAARNDLIKTYTFLENLHGPGAVRITDNGEAMVYADSDGLTYLRFGFTGRALDDDDLPLVGAAVTFTTRDGQRTTVSDQDGWFTFGGFSSEPSGTLEVTKGSDSYTERINVCWQCSSSTRPTPCVVVTSPADGGRTTNASVTVRGTILPASFDFTRVPVFVDVGTPGGIDSYPVEFTGPANTFEARGVALDAGESVVTVRIGATGAYDGGRSLPVRVIRSAAPAATQAVAGVALDAAGNPRPGAVVRVLVDGSVAEEVQADGCGYYTVSGLPLGAVTTEVVP